MTKGDDDEVGYKRPPKATRFQKGKSGNPKGRPKKRPSIHEEANKALFSQMPITLNGKRIKVPAIRAVFHRLAHEAANGELKATKQVIDLTKMLALNGKEANENIDEGLFDQDVLRLFEEQVLANAKSGEDK
jgi:hypothetical protein